MKHLIAAAITALYVLTAQAAQWEPIVQSMDGTVQFVLDKSSVVTSGFTTEFTVASNRPAHLAHWRVECRIRKADILRLEYLDNDERTTSVVQGPMKVETAPGEVADLIITFVCKKIAI